MKLNKILPFIMIVLISTILSGCWDIRQVEELLLSDAMVLDIAKNNGVNKYSITFISTKQTTDGSQQSGMTGGTGGGVTQQWFATTKGSNFEDAITRFSIRSPRYTYFADNQVIIFGEEIAKEGVSDALDFILRKRQIRLRNYVVVSQQNSIEKLSATSEFENSISSELIKIIKTGSRQCDYFHFNDMKNFIQDMITLGSDAWAPIMNIIIPKDITEDENESLIVHQTALFRNDKFVGILNEEETQGFLMLKNKAQRGNLTIKIDDKYASFTYDSVKANRKLTIDKGIINIDYFVKLKGNIKETNLITNFSDKDINNMEKLLSKKVEKNIHSAIKTCKESGSDALCIGRFIHIKKPNLWQKYKDNWYEEYENIIINAKVNVEIIGTNFSSKPITGIKEKR